MTRNDDYMAPMLSDPDLKRLHWRAHHRGTKEADLLIGGFFDANHESWGSGERALFETMLEEQDVDIMAWAHGTAEPPARFAGPMIERLKRLNYIRIVR
jgi:antitoxin CptB